MKNVYYIDVGCGSAYAQSLVNTMNEKITLAFTKSKDARDYLSKARRYLAWRYADEIKAVKKHCKAIYYDEVITIDLYKARVDDDFDIETDNIFETDNYHIIDSRYLLGRY